MTFRVFLQSIASILLLDIIYILSLQCNLIQLLILCLTHQERNLKYITRMRTMHIHIDNTTCYMMLKSKIFSGVSDVMNNSKNKKKKKNNLNANF